MPDWLTETLRALPALVWIFAGMGMPWALVALPRRDWADRAMVACLTLAFGPALLTAWMFILGTLGQDSNPNPADDNPMQTSLLHLQGGTSLMRPDLILLGTVVTAVVGWALVQQKRRNPSSSQHINGEGARSGRSVTSVGETHKVESGQKDTLAPDEKLLIFFIVLATLARWVITSWLPFGAWDELWVYGYQGRIYTLTGFIPADIGYYPQFLPLLYAFSQIVSLGGAISDHAARAVVPFLQVGSILAVYLLASRLFNRRTGIIAAALWALYPHLGYWTRIGDLEIPVTFGFTGAAAFFLMAWTGDLPPSSDELRRTPRDENRIADFHLVPQPLLHAMERGERAKRDRGEVTGQDFQNRHEARKELIEARRAVLLQHGAYDGAGMHGRVPLSWRLGGSELRRRYALIAGLFLGIAMWTKPTAGAFIWGVLLLLAADLLRVRGDWRRWLPRLEVALITGITCIPLGAVWYVRNILIGHDAIVLPGAFWLTQAERTGAEFGWILLALAVLLAYLYLAPLPHRPDWRGVLVGAVLVGVGVLPSILNPHRMGWWEWLAFGAGLGLLVWTLWGYYRSIVVFDPTAPLRVNGKREQWVEPPPSESKVEDKQKNSHLHDDAGARYLASVPKLFWAYLLALPYFVTWFYSYSYHYRLSFPIVPLLLLPTAVILAHWIRPDAIRRWNFPCRFGFTLALVGLCLPGTLIAVYDEGLGWDWLWTIPAADDYSEAALLGVRDTLQTYIDTHDEPPVVIAPGLQTLPFFFPTAEIRIMETPRRFGELDGVTHFVLSREALLAYEASGGAAPFYNQWLGSLPRQNVTTLVGSFQDQAFFYDLYELHPAERFKGPTDGAAPAGDVVFGGFARYVAHRVLNSSLTNDGVQVEIWWQAIQPAPQDYPVFVHFVNPDDLDTVWAQADGPVVPTSIGWYSTTFWEPGEFVIDPRHFYLQNPDTPYGTNYRLNIGFYDPATNERLPVTINGEPAGDSYLLESAFSR